MHKIKHNLICILVLFLTGCATVISFDEMRERAVKHGIQNGIYQEFYPNKKLKAEINLKNSVIEGTAKSFDGKGNLYAVQNYANGENDGEYRYYFSDGKNVKIIGNAKIVRKMDGSASIMKVVNYWQK